MADASSVRMALLWLKRTFPDCKLAYYQAPTMSDAYSAYSVVQDIIGGARAASPGEEDMLLGEEEEAEEGEVRKKPKHASPRDGRGERREGRQH